MWVVIAIALIPALLYIPPVQTFVKNIACREVEKASGMHIGIDSFRLRWPLRVALNGVTIVQPTGDTMVSARMVLVDVKALPLLKLDVKVRKLQLVDGYYRMVSADSSMIMTVKAGRLTAGSKTRANIRTGKIFLDNAHLSRGDISLYMNVWKQEQKPPTPGTFVIEANSLQLDSIRFAMSMLPTIDTLSLEAESLMVKSGKIDLVNNDINIGIAKISDGNATYLTPTPQYIASHPAPAPSPYPSIPMQIKVDTIALSGFKALYATKGAKPTAGFDPSYISMVDVGITLADFYNRASTVKLPITRLEGRERSGLQITSGSGCVTVDSTGVNLDNLQLRTLYSNISATAELSFPMMAMNPSGPLRIDAKASLGIPDIEAFMPTVKQFTKKLPRRNPLDIDIEAVGSLASLAIPKLNVGIRNLLNLQASGNINNPLEPQRLAGKVKFDGKVANPTPLQAAANLSQPHLPPFTLKGSASVVSNNYGAEFTLNSLAGNIAAIGKVGLTSEKYDADIDIKNFNIGKFAPATGIGLFTGHISASGAGFNPTLPGAATHISANVSHLDYGKANLGGIDLRAELDNGQYQINLNSHNPLLLGNIDAYGTVAPDLYTADVTATLQNFDAYALGFTTDSVRGNGIFTLTAKASPDKWLYDATLSATQLELKLPEYYFNFPRGIEARFYSGTDTTMLTTEADRLNLNFQAATGLKNLIADFSAVSEALAVQLKDKSLDVKKWQPSLPKFNLQLEAAGNGILHQILDLNGLAFDSVSANITNDTLIYGKASLLGLTTQSMALDSIFFDFTQRNAMIDYSARLGNRPGNMDEFHQVEADGYVGGQRAALYLRQRNLQGQTGYKLGFTAALNDSVLDLHFTPLNAIIAYLPWTFNDDNYIEYDFNRRIDANLKASSAESSISILTQKSDSIVASPVFVKLENIHIQDFIGLVPDAPNVKGSINADFKMGWNKKALIANGSIGVKQLVYENNNIGDLDLNVKAGLNVKGQTAGMAALTVNSQKALVVRGILRNDSTGIRPGDINVLLDRFPLSLANAFIPSDAARLQGTLSGHMGLTGSLAKPLLNGAIAFDSTFVTLPIMGGKLKLDNDSVRVADNVVDFEDFNVWGANDNPLSLNGKVSATNLAVPTIDLKLNATDFMLINNDRRANSDIYGKILLTLDATAKGPLNLLDVNGNVNILSGTNAFYTLSETQQLVEQEDANLVKFVNFADTTTINIADSIAPAMLMRINATLNISNGVQATVNLSTNGTDKVQLTPYGQLTYFQSYMGDMRLNGQLNLGTGFARYAIPVVGEKRFDIEPDSYISWGGDILNPRLHLLASDNVKSVVQTSSNNSRVVEFNIGLSVTNTLSSPNILFDLSTDDLTIENELQSMSADQRSSEAMNMLLYGKYMGPGAASSSGSPIGNPLYSFLESKLNSWAANNIRGVDLSFGIDQYNTTDNGRSGTSTSYSYQVSKSLFDNKFKIVVGGNYNTDASGDENLAQNLISNISFQYMLRQTNTMSMYLTLFRHNDYENILEGEITEMGAGYVMQRKLSNLKQLFSWLKPKKRKKKQTEAKPDTIIEQAPEAPEPVNTPEQ